MSAELILETTEPSILIIEERKHKDIVIGVPHHAPAGKTTRPCPNHRDSDENAGFLGRYLAERLDCCSVIACNYPFDVNKALCSDYAVQIAQWNPKVLIEIHGHGGGKAKFHIEISSGSATNENYSKSLADLLGVEFQKDTLLQKYKIGGEYSAIYFKASDSATITDSRWISYHIELPSDFRKPQVGVTGKPPSLGYQFCTLLEVAISKLHRA